MGLGIRGGVARQLQTLLEAGAIGSMDDAELLGRYLRRDDSAEPAFAALVDRHGRMVLRVCFDTLGDSHEAQDAAQATFFILARKAASIRNPEALPSWLHGTARRVASRALRDSIRRRRHERRRAEIAEKQPIADNSRQGWHELHEELARLPDRYREPIILCDLAGLTHEQAAGKLGCPPRTLETRLYRGRERLKVRLVRRGVAPSVALAGVASATESQAAMSPSWVAESAGAAVRLAGRGSWAAAGEVSTNAVRLARGHIKETAMFKLKLVLASGLLLGVALPQFQSDSPPKQEPAKATTEAKARPTEPQAFIDPDRPKTYGWPVSVSGRAFDPEGKPIAGARVYMASRKGEYRLLGGSTTDAEGRYAFSMPLPIERTDVVNGRDEGAFQVFGEAKGFGFAFRPQKWFYPYPKPSNITYEPGRIDPPERYESTDKIVMDLRFPPAARLVGTVVDDRGKPLSDIRLEIRNCETLKPIDVNIVGGWTFDTLNERNSAPPSMKIRTTDALGRFDFEGMPADCRFRISVSAKGFPRRWINVATTDEPQPDYDGAPVLIGDMRVTLATAMDVPIRMIFADTKQPANKVLVQAAAGYVSDFKTSDDQGRATLRLPPGKYRMENWPERGTPYLVTEAELVLGNEPPTEPIVHTLRRAAILEVYVLDEATGAALTNVDLWHETEGRREKYVMRSWEVATRIARRDSPRTDAQGKLRVFVEPGEHRFGVGLESYPLGYDVVQSEGRAIECRAGETSALKFTMRKRSR